MGGATRFLLLVATPFSLLHPRCSSSLYRISRLSLRPLSNRHTITLYPHSLRTLTVKSSQSFHSQSNSLKDDPFYTQQQQHPWPEWSKLIHTLSPAAEVHGIVPEDDFVSYEYLSEEFVRSSSSCLALARNRPDILGLLSRKDIEVVVQYGQPYLFKSARDTERRMRSYLDSTGINVSSDQAQTVDLMKYLLSYASNPTVSSERNNLYSRELIESSVRNLLSELAEVGFRVPVSNFSTPEHQVSGYYGQTPRPLGQNIEMKKGDWNCPRCSFMNFARNMKCLECEEPRPKRKLTGGEWECPQCDFCNYGRNTVCLRCNCKRPGENSFGTFNSTSGLGYNNGDYANKGDMGSRLPAKEENAQRRFSKGSQFNSISDMSNSAVTEGYFSQTGSANENLQDGPPRRGNSGYVPFVPLPADMFAKKNQSSNMEVSENVTTESSRSVSSKSHYQRDPVSTKDEFGRSGDNFQLPKNPENKVQSQQNKEREAEKSDRWFKRVAELHDVPDLTSAISDEDFPEIMPMRKGENRFVVSKKKDRSLTSPMYKRQMAAEQASNTNNFVPFVPFPPDYFAKKDQPHPESTNPPVKSINNASSISGSLGMGPLESDEARQGEANLNQGSITKNQQTDGGNWSSNYPVNNIGAPNSGSETQNSPSSKAINNDSGNVRYSGKENNAFQTGLEKSYTSQPTSNLAGPTHCSGENENVNSGWPGKSLEGSAVKEVDPLDMSEEAKAERWFRRVAQIKDISELSQIPDEDFPSIMPMRKGVNRFVVSKRKTPLERRLTSPQYRRNLPVVSSDPMKKEDGESS